MKSNILFKERGQALVVVALAAVVLFGFSALAIDGSAKMSDRRHAQNAADTAAVAAALAKVNALLDATKSNTPLACSSASGGPYSDVCTELLLDGLDRAISNGYGNDSTKSTVEIYSPPISGYYSTVSNKDEYVQVIITSHVKTSLMRVLGVTQSDNVVQAVAFAHPGGKLASGAAIAEYNPGTSSGCSGTFVIGGSSTITLNNGGVFVNSSAPDCAFEQTGGCPSNGDPLLVINGGTVNSAGNGNVDFDACFTNPPVPAYDQTQIIIPDDVDVPDVPSQCSESYQTNHNQGQTTNLYAGHYSKLPPNGAKNTVVLHSGIYCVDDDIQWSGTNIDYSGTDITIFLKQGKDLKITGGTINLDATGSGDYAGYLFIAYTDFTGSPTTCTINGSSNITLSGTIFAPYCDLTINGDNGSGTTVNLGTQVIAWNVKLTGSSTINFTYNPADNAKARRKVGLLK